MTTKATIVIPARLASTRFPEKVLAAQTGKPLVQHVAEGAARAACAGRVVVAADHARIADALRPFGTTVVMTREDHPNGTSRLAEAAAALGLADDEIIVNAQGDEPEMPGAVIDAAVAALVESRRAAVGTAAAPFAPGESAADPNIVKVVRTLDGHALYFSRALIPHDRDGAGMHAGTPALRHVGVYAYRVGFLKTYIALPATPCERAERLEQLRVLEHGHAIAVAVVPAAHAGIDTPEQYAAFVARWRAGDGGGQAARGV
ncbi:MAG: 3-deoxy-manno-octulosonate cytidylyltransferase [Phycisphaerales bacterium]